MGNKKTNYSFKLERGTVLKRVLLGLEGVFYEKIIFHQFFEFVTYTAQFS